MIDPNVIARLIELGRSEPKDEADIQDKLGNLEFCSRQISAHWTEWRAVTQPMTSDELIAITKGLTLAEKCPRWLYRGSVSPVINVYNEIDGRGDYELSWNTAKWVIEHSDNPYAPFGHMPRRWLFEARLARYQVDQCPLPKRGYLSGDLSNEYEATKKRRSQASIQQDQQDLLARRQRRLSDRENHETRRRLAHEAWIVLRSNTQDLTALARLQYIATTNYPINQFPREYFEVSDDMLAALPLETTRALIQRLAGRRSDPWRKLLTRLTTLSS